MDRKAEVEVIVGKLWVQKNNMGFCCILSVISRCMKSTWDANGCNYGRQHSLQKLNSNIVKSRKGSFSAPNPIKVSTLLPGFGTVREWNCGDFSAKLFEAQNWAIEIFSSPRLRMWSSPKLPRLFHPAPESTWHQFCFASSVYAQEFWGLDEIATTQFLINSFTPG